MIPTDDAHADALDWTRRADAQLERDCADTTFSRERALRFAGAIDAFAVSSDAYAVIRADLNVVDPTGAAAAVWTTLHGRYAASERDAVAATDAAGITR